MSTAAVSSNSINQQLHQYFQTRQSDLQQLNTALASGDQGAAQTAFNNIVSLGQEGPFANGQPFYLNQREQDFSAVGQAIQSGDLAGAQQAFNDLKATFQKPTVEQDPTSASPASGAGPEIVLNLSNSSGSASPEQITVNIANQASGGEQISISAGNQGSSPQQVTFNVGANNNEQIVLNLLDSSSSASGSPANPGLSVSA
jgi:hypothetical protein